MPSRNEALFRALFARNAQTIRELHGRIDALVPQRGTPEGRTAWLAACAEFHARYDDLAFPGGYAAGLRRIQEGDSNTIDIALSFLELRPYFFRSQYMRTKLTRLLKRVPLNVEQAERLQRVRVKPG